MDRSRIHDPRHCRARSSAAGVVLLAAALAFLLPSPIRAQGATLAIEACGCLLEPGDRAEVRVHFSNPGSTDADLLVVMQLPNGKSLFFTPFGLVTTPRSWRPVPAGTPLTTLSVLDQDLTPQSLPFGNHPLLPPFRYRFVSFLSESVTGQQLTPFAAGFFDFAPQEPSPPPDAPGSLYLVPHQHADIAWLDREEVNLADAAAYVRDSILEARRRPDYRFIIDQPLVFREFASRFPELVGELRSLVDRGVAEAAGGYFVQPDLNLLSGESLVRQAIYGQEYLAAEWGLRARIAWNIDSFGHPHQMPQISKKAGMDFYALSRGIADFASLGLEGSEFVWESPDGSRLLAHYMPYGYQLARAVGDGAADDQEITEVFRRVQGKASGADLLAMAGADVSEHVFNPALPEAAEGWSRQQVSGVQATLTTATEFFETVASSGAPFARLSSIEFQNDGEPASPRVFPGAYASRIGIKQTNSRLERLLLDVEKLSTLASLEGAAYPEASLREQGERLAINQFHDYLPGTGVDSIYQDPDDALDDLGDRFTAVDAALRQHLDEATAHIAGRIDTTLPGEDPVEAIVIFNTMAWERSELVRIPIDPAPPAAPARLLDPDGREIPYQRIVAQTETSELVFLARVPPLGYATYWLAAGEPAWPPGESVSEHRGSLKAGVGRFTVHLDDRGFVRGIFSDATGESVVQLPGAPAIDNLGGLLWWADERYGNAYDYGPPENTGFPSGGRQRLFLARGPVLTRIVALGPIAERSMARREIRLAPGLGRVDFETTVYWSDVNKNLYLRFPLSARPGALITEGVPYGFRERGAGHYPALEWADFGTEAIGLSVLNQGLFDHSFSLDPGAITAETAGPQILDITLLRSLNRAVFGEFPSTLMQETGVHQYRYSLLPHHGSWRLAETPRRAWEFGSPLVAVRAPARTGPLPPEKSYLALNPGSHAIVSVLQRREEDLIVRLYETDGEAGQHVLGLPSLAIDGATETNFLGDPVRSLGRAVPLVLQLAPEEIETVLLRAPRPAPAPDLSPLDLRRTIDLATAATLRPGSGSTDLSARVVPSFVGADANDLSGRAASAHGDVDGDGLDDVLIAAQNADGPDNAGPDFAGEVYVIFGRPGSEFGSRAPLDQVADLTLYGSSPRGFAGKDVTSGDLDGDGFDDIIIGSIANPTGEESRTLSGVTYVVFGRPRAEFPERIDLGSAADLAAWGQGGEIAGQRVIAADFDGDGRDDLAIGAPSADGPESARNGAGEVYLIFGAPRSQLRGTRKLEFQYDAVIHGADELDSLGWGIAAGDLDGDGRDDLAIGAIDADGAGDLTEGSGEVYLFWGGERSRLAGSFDMAALDNAVVLYGLDVVDSAGFHLSTGDVDADGRDDLLIGAPLADGLNDSVGDLIGEAYLVYGDERARFPLESSLAEAAGLTIYGTSEDGHLGRTLLLSDLNGDGHSDLVLSAPVADGPGGTRTDSGTVYGLFGRPRDLLPPRLELSEETANFTIHGAVPFASAGYAIDAGDVDGDGSLDLLLGAPFTSNPKTKNGETFLLFGSRFAASTAEQLLVLKAEFDPETGLLDVVASSSLDPAALSGSPEIFLHDGSSTIRVTHNSHDDRNLALGETLLAWESAEGGDTEIDLFDGDSTRRLTDNGFDDVDPTVDGSRVVWAGFDGNDWEIFLFDAEGVRQLTDNELDDVSPDLSRTDVVWSGFDGNDFEIFLHDGASTRALTDNGTDDREPRVSQGRVIWLGEDGQDTEVFLFDGSGTVQITDNERDEESPVLDAGLAAWLGSDGGDTEVFAYDGTGVLRLTFNDATEREVGVSGGRVAWISGEGGEAEVFVFDGRTVSPVTATPVEESALSIDGASLVWQAPRAGDPVADGEIFLHDGARLVQLTDDRLEDMDPIVRGARVAWRTRVVDHALALDGFGYLTYDPVTGLFVGTFQAPLSPALVTVRSPSGSAVSTPVASLSAGAGDVPIVQLTDDGGPRPDEWPDVSSGQVAWSGFDGHDYEIYLYDGQQIRPITSNDTDDVSPRLHSGRIVWEGYDGADREIYLFDGTRVLQITDNDVTDTGPRIHDGLIAWESWVGGAPDIYAYQDGAVLRLTETPFPDLSPRVRDGQVVWQGFDGADFEIYRWDGAAVQALTGNDRDDIEPQTAGGAVVWLGDDGSDLEVFHHAGGVTTRITDDAESAAAPAFDGTTIVWQQSDGHDTEIFAHRDGSVARITDNSFDDVLPSVDAGSIAWQGLAPASSEVFLFDAATGAVTQLTADTLEDRPPRIDGGIVVWSANDNGEDTDVLLFDGESRRNLTSNGAPAPDEFPDIDQDLIAWQSWDGTDTEIWIHDGTRTIQATVNPFQDLQPAVGDGIVVWQGLDDFRRRLDDPGGGVGGTGATLVGGDFEIFLWNGREVLRLTANPGPDDGAPRVDSRQIAWLQTDGGDQDVYFFDGTRVTRLTDDDFQQEHARLDSGLVVWQGWDGTDSEIYLYDGAAVRPLTDNAFNDLAPEVHAGRVTWAGFDGHDYEIFLWDGSETRQLTSNEQNDSFPQIHDGRVAWQGWDGSDPEIFLYDGSAVVQLTDNNLVDARPRLEDGKVVWQASDGLDLEIFVYDGSRVFRLTDNVGDDRNAEISNGRIVWQGFDGLDLEIYLATLPRPGQTP